jgi:signal transduction histidine kinase
LASAIANLVDNALKYSAQTPAAHVDVAVRARDDTVELTVRDNGPGVPAAALARLGQRFFRLDERLPGTGLGLASVNAIAQLHRGSLVVEDAAPGLRARLKLPAG